MVARRIGIAWGVSLRKEKREKRKGKSEKRKEKKWALLGVSPCIMAQPAVIRKFVCTLLSLLWRSASSSVLI